MSEIPDSLIQEMRLRGLIHQTTDDEGLPVYLKGASRTLYTGFDPTADSLHVGHLLAILNLRRFQRAGHKPIVLIGGATGMIGDPSGKSEERKLLSEDDVLHNVAAIKTQMSRFLEFGESGNGALLLNNADWTKPYSFLDFLRVIGKHFPVNVMLSKDSVQSRLNRTDTGLSYTEFSYMLIQAHDFVFLNKNYGCSLQVGGSDQWGNITAGIELARRMSVSNENNPLFGITCKLLTKKDGKKFGKTESGAVWLDADRTSPYQFYQYWINQVEDSEAEKILMFFSDLNRNEIADLIAEHTQKPELRLAQKQIATELTQLVHGENGLNAALKATDIFFGGVISEFSDKELGGIFSDVPSQEVSRARLDESSEEKLSILEALVLAGLAKSRNEARRTVQQGGAYINNQVVSDVDKILSTTDLASETILVLRSGKKRYSLLKFV